MRPSPATASSITFTSTGFPIMMGVKIPGKIGRPIRATKDNLLGRI
jgi:hypothetical protein